MAELTLENVYYRYPGAKKDVLTGVNIAFRPGTVTAILGQSGAGKSTLLYLISGLDTPTSGHIRLDGEALGKKQLDAYRREQVATISQSYLLFPTRTALENVLYPLQLRGVEKEAAVQEARARLLSVGIQRELHDRLPNRLSGGEQQRVAIARCLAARASIIAADEPTGNLDEENAREVMGLLRALAHKHNKTVILVTHDRLLAEQTDIQLRLEYGVLEAVAKKES